MICRDCQTGYPATAEDPVPVLCSACFDERMQSVTRAASVLIEHLPPEVFARWSMAQLVGYVGMSYATAAAFLEKVGHLADVAARVN